MIIVSALSLSLRDKERLREREIERELDNNETFDYIISNLPTVTSVNINCIKHHSVRCSAQYNWIIT